MVSLRIPVLDQRLSKTQRGIAGTRNRVSSYCQIRENRPQPGNNREIAARPPPRAFGLIPAPRRFNPRPRTPLPWPDRTASVDPILAPMIGFDLDPSMARVRRRSCCREGGLAVNLPRRLGRSQVVRQRILIPRYGGSNPPAPAKTRLITAEMAGETA